MKQIFSSLLLLFLLGVPLHSQSFLHTDGKKIVNGQGENVLLRGIGTGNWMLQDGYMMQTSAIGGTQHEFRNKLIETIGEARTDSFYNAWLQYHFTRTDVDSMKSWGYNSVRVAMHYKWFTPPIEAEPVEGEITWIEKGFVMIDSLLGWCEDNEMYLILDLHGAPGGQGEDANISDYDPSKPSLWESDLNKDKTVALWAKLAERYAQEEWLGGYDLINETNWTFPEGNNLQLREVFGRITDAIREVDDNHIIYIEGNGFANDFSGLTPPWDDNMVYSFHKYWNYNVPGAIDWVLAMRDEYDIPIWLGETGENSNTWFTNLIALCGKHNIGWSWWPVKKPGINNPLRVVVNEDYTRLIDYWKGAGSEMTEEEAFQAVLQFAENHKIENCIFQRDVVDAKIRQPHTIETISFADYSTGEKIFFTDYDLGRVGYAYFDNDTANYRLEAGQDFTNWNQGWSYRNDGVDIQVCSDEDNSSNGYNVAWTQDGEWMQYSVSVDQEAAWQLNVRYATANEGRLVFQIHGVPVTQVFSLPSTGGWQSWETLTIDDIILPEGDIKIRCVIDQGGVNLNYFSFVNPVTVENVEFNAVSAKLNFPGNVVQLFLNKPFQGEVTSAFKGDFGIQSNGNSVNVSQVLNDASFPSVFNLVLEDYLNYNEEISVNYTGSTVVSGGQDLVFFELGVQNNLPLIFGIPGEIEAEDFAINNGFQLEACQDQGGGLNTAYANPGDYTDYTVEIADEGKFQVDYRVATEQSSARLIFFQEKEEEFIPRDTMNFHSTGGWQNWETQISEVFLERGRYKIRLMTLSSEYNLNWIKLSVGASINENDISNKLVLSPNPARDFVTVKLPYSLSGDLFLNVYNAAGNLVKISKQKGGECIRLNLENFSPGLYFLLIRSGERVSKGKFLVAFGD